MAYEARLRRHGGRAWGAGFALRERRPERCKLLAKQSEISLEPRDNLHPDPFRIRSVSATHFHTHEGCRKEDRDADATEQENAHSQTDSNSNGVADAAHADGIAYAFSNTDGHAFPDADQHAHTCANGHAETHAQAYPHAWAEEKADPNPRSNSYDRGIQIQCSDSLRTGERSQIQRTEHHHNLAVEIRRGACFG